MRELALFTVFIAGVALVTIGLALMYVPAAYIYLGSVLLYCAWRLVRTR